MKISVISDIQLHSYPAFSRINADGRNSRLQHGLDALQFAVDSAEGGYLVILGDLFEDRQRLGIDVLDAVTEVMIRASQSCRGIYIVVGNHDQFYRDGSVTSLRHFGSMPGVKVVYDCLSDKIDGVPCHFAAFQHDQNKVRQWIATLPKDGLLFLHQAMLGAEADGGFLYEKSDALTVDDVRPGDFKEILIGHFHKPQSLAPNVHYVGSPYQIKMNEIGEEKRIAVITTSWDKPEEYLSLQWVPVTVCPTFRRAAADEFDIMPEAEKAAHFWEIEGILDRTPDNVRLKPVAKEAVVYTAACSDLTAATDEWLRAKGRADLTVLALAFLS